MHDDIAEQNHGAKKPVQSKKKVYGPADPPGPAAKKILIFGLVGALSIPLICLLSFADISGVFWTFLALVWLGLCVCMVLGVFRGKYELDAIGLGHSPPRGKVPTLAGMLAGGVSIPVNIVIIVIALWGSGPSVSGNPSNTFNEYVEALENDDFEKYLECLAPSLKYDIDEDEDGTPESAGEEHLSNMKGGFNKRRKHWKGLEFITGKITIDKKNDENEAVDITLRVFAKIKNRPGVPRRDIDIRMVRVRDEWKISVLPQ